MYRAGRTCVYVERNKHLLETFFDQGMVFIHDLLGRNAFFHCPDGNRHTMFIAASDEEDIFFAGPLKTCINVCRYITASQMTDMNRAIGIGKCSSDQDAVEFFHSLKTGARLRKDAKIPF